MKKKKTVTELIDDIDGTAGAQTIPFAVNGTRYEIELTDDNYDDLLSALKPFTDHARVVGGKRPSSNGQPKPAEVRAWAEKAGVAVNAKGRVPQDVIDQFKASKK